MKILLDTHIAIWTIINTNLLSKEVIDEIENYDNEVYVSMASIWEVAIKSAKDNKKVGFDEKEFVSYITKMDFNILPIKINHIANLRNLQVYNNNIIHKNPFDRLLVSQSKVEDMFFFTKDEKISNYKYNNIRLI